MKHLLPSLLAVCAISAHAEFFTVAQIKERLDSTEPTQRALAAGFIAGVWDAGMNAAFCPVGDAARLNLGGVMKAARYVLDRTPDDKPANEAILNAFGRAMPCKANDPRGML